MDSVSRTIQGSLLAHAESNPDKVIFRFLDSRGQPRSYLTYETMVRRSGSIAGGLIAQGLTKRQPVIIGCADPERFILAFLGVSLAGGLPVPVPAKGRRQSRIEGIVSDCKPFAIVLDEETRHSRNFNDQTPVLAVSDLDGPEFYSDSAGAADPAFIQYTSGSTGKPKGVVVSQRQITLNSRMIERAFNHDQASCIASWLPLFHDMGLVGTALHPILHKIESVLMPPEGFVQTPEQWLRMISDYRATTSGAPDFAYRACSAITDLSLLEGIDLSSWNIAYTGAELIRPDTMYRFESAMKPFGFNSTAWLPCYGLAETTLLSTCGTPQDYPQIVELDLEELDQSGAAGTKREVTSVGRASPETTIRIVEPKNSTELPEGCIGEIWIAGDHVSDRYWNSENNLRDGKLASYVKELFLRTGDLGLLLNGELFIVGRNNNMMIINGRNIYPFDVEVAAGTLKSLRDDRILATSISSELFSQHFNVNHNPIIGNEYPVLIAEISNGFPKTDRSQLSLSIYELVREKCDVELTAIVLVGRGEVEVTTSGKLRYERAIEKLLNNEYRRRFVWLSTLVRETANDAVLELAGAIKAKMPISTLVDIIAQICANDKDTVYPADTLLVDTGLTSLGLMHFSSQLTEITGTKIDLGILYGGSSLLDLAFYLKSCSERTDDTMIDTKYRRQDDYGLGSNSVLQRRAEVGDGAYVLAFSVSGPAKIINGICTEARSLPRLYQSLRLRPDASGDFWYLPDEVCDPPLINSGYFMDRQSRELAFRQASAEQFDLIGGPLKLVLASGPKNERSLLVMVHHAAADFWIMASIVRRLADTAQGIAVHPVEAKKSVRLDNTTYWKYWEKVFSGLVYQPLPRDYTGARGGKPYSSSFVISKDTICKLKSRTKQTAFIVLATGLMSVFGRWSGSWDRVVGVPVAGALDGSDGYGVQVLPIRTTLAEDLSFSAAAEKVGRQVGAAMSNRHGSLKQLRSHIPAELSGMTELFDVAIVHLSGSPIVEDDFLRLALRNDDSHCRVNSVQFSSANLGPHALECPLEVIVCEIGQTIEGVIRVDSGLFSQSTASEIAQRVSQFALNAASSPELTLGALIDCGQIASVSNTAEKSCNYASLHSMLAIHARNNSEMNAIECNGISTSYYELNHKSDHLARRILETCVNAQRIAVCCDSQSQAIIAMFASLKSGALFIPIDPALPLSRQRMILEDHQVDLLLHEKSQRLASALVGDWIWMSIEEELTQSPNASWLLPGIDIDDHAYMVFTSGSTGAPKAVIHTHSTFSSFLSWQATTLDIKPGARVAQVAAAGFDVALCEIFGTLCHGGTLVQPNRSSDLSPDRFLEWLDETKVTVLQITPNFLSAALRASDLWPSSLSVIANVGEPLPVTLAAEILCRGGPSIRLLNIYGPTETIAATWHCVTSQDLKRPRIPAGFPIPGRSLELRDEKGELVPRGTRGEVCIRSRYMSDAYAGSDLKGGFDTRPNDSVDRRGLYRTGDIGRFCLEGQLELFGRQDNQVKLNGVRIELEEVELALLQHPSVSAAVVTLDSNRGGPSRLLAAVEAHSDVTSGDIRRQSLNFLPAYFVPAIVIVVEHIPRSLNGKINRRESSVLMVERANDLHVETEATDQMTETQLYVANLWTQVIPDAVSISSSSNFFSCGGHSISAMQLLNRVQLETGTEISLAEFLAAPTVSAMSEIIGLSAKQTIVT